MLLFGEWSRLAALPPEQPSRDSAALHPSQLRALPGGDGKSHGSGNAPSLAVPPEQRAFRAAGEGPGWARSRR